nr:hypothetical protein [Burkholderia plantarii]
MTLPTTRPRESAPAIRAASATSICTSVQPSPIANAAASSATPPVARAMASNAMPSPPSVSSTSRRFSTQSPSGASTSRPVQYPSWLDVTIQLAAQAGSPTSRAIVASSGCAK